jgi:CRISPR-associated protein Cas1
VASGPAAAENCSCARHTWSLASNTASLLLATCTVSDFPTKTSQPPPCNNYAEGKAHASSKLYRYHSQRTGGAWDGRIYKPGQPFEAGDDVNRLLSAANSALYGLCHAAIVGIGAAPALGFVHTGGATSFVLDIADLYKADYTIPLAFDLAAKGLTSERDARTAFRDRVANGRLMIRVVQDIKNLLLGDGNDTTDQDAHELWDDKLGSVPGGVNWANEYADSLDESTLLSVIGPDLNEPKVDW